MLHEDIRLEPKRRQWDAYVNRHANGMSKRTQRNHVTLCVTLRAVYGNVFKLSARHNKHASIPYIEDERDDYTVSIKLLINATIFAWLFSFEVCICVCVENIFLL